LTNAEYLLTELVTALENAYISSWQSTAAWQKQLEEAREYLNKMKERFNMNEKYEVLSSVPEDVVVGFIVRKSLSQRNLFDIFSVDKHQDLIACVETDLEMEVALEIVSAVNSTFPTYLTDTEMLEHNKVKK